MAMSTPKERGDEEVEEVEDVGAEEGGEEGKFFVIKYSFRVVKRNEA